MKSVSVADAKTHLSALIERAQAGEEVAITELGKPVARLVPIEQPRKPIDIQALREFIAKMPVQEESAGDFMRRIRDEERY